MPNISQTLAERWLILEYDTLCEVDLQELYAPCWDADIVVSNLIMPPTRWSAFLTNRCMPDDLRPFSAGIVPMTGLLFKPSALDQLSILTATRTDVDVISEYRTGTFAKCLELDVRVLPGLKDMVSCHEVTPNRPGLWHPVKAVK